MQASETADAEIDMAAADQAAADSAVVDKATADSVAADKAAAEKVAAVSGIYNTVADKFAADGVVAALSSAMNANVEGVRRGGKAPEVLEGEQLYVDAQTDLGMLYVRVSINASLFSLLTHLCFAFSCRLSSHRV